MSSIQQIHNQHLQSGLLDRFGCAEELSKKLGRKVINLSRIRRKIKNSQPRGKAFRRLIGIQNARDLGL